MKANEFVKKFGLNKAIIIAYGFKTILEYSWYDHDLEAGNGVHRKVVISELRKLIWSHNLVNAIGGLDFAKNYIGQAEFALIGSHKEYLKQAIADVESCQ